MIRLVMLSLLFLCLTLAHNFCGHNQFQCLNGQCVYKSRVCDLSADCQDWTDENQCGWCRFNQTSSCGWKSLGLKYNCLDGNCALIQQFDSGKGSFRLTSPSRMTNSKSMSKNCMMILDILLVNIDYSICKLTISTQSQNRTTEVANFIYTKNKFGFCNGAGCSITVNVRLGYVKKNSTIQLTGEIEKSSYGLPLKFGVKSIQLSNCNPSHVAFDCNFSKDKNCKWFDGNRFVARWKWNSTGYIYNDQASLAEIRSPVITGKVGAKYCLGFKYINNSTENALHVTKINLETDDTEHVLWHSRDTTGNTWLHNRVDIETNIDIDIGFISVAVEGMVAIDNITLSDQACG